MKGFSVRERRIIAAVYHDCERIALEQVNGNILGLAGLFIVRKEQLLKYGCNLPRSRYKLYKKLFKTKS